MSDAKGKFIWYDLMTSDTAAAEAFYKSVVGWGAQDAGTPGTSYTLFTLGNDPVCGLMVPPEDAKPGFRLGWRGYVAVENVDAVAAQVVQAGGNIRLAAADIPGVGRFAVADDPQGARFVLFRGIGEPPLAPAPGTPGRVGWHELAAAEGATAFDFYAALFGWTKAEAFDMGPMGLYQLFTTGGAPVGGMMTKPETVPTPFWLYYINVEAIDAAADRVTAAGGKILLGPCEVPGGSWILNALDPQGLSFALVAPRR